MSKDVELKKGRGYPNTTLTLTSKNSHNDERNIGGDEMARKDEVTIEFTRL